MRLIEVHEEVLQTRCCLSAEGNCRRGDGPTIFWWGWGQTEEGSLSFVGPRFHALALRVVHGKMSPLFSGRPPFVWIS
jgi:hypothetical protein